MATAPISVTIPSGGGNFAVNADDIYLYKAESASTARLWYSPGNAPMKQIVVDAIASGLSQYFDDGVQTITGALDAGTYYVPNSKIISQSQTDKYIDLNWSGSTRRIKYA